MLKRLTPGMMLLCIACADKSPVGIDQLKPGATLTAITSSFQVLHFGSVLHDTLVPPAVFVRDQSGLAVSNAAVTFTLRRLGNSQTVLTDHFGHARMQSWIVEPRTGSDTVIVTAGKLTTAFVIDVAAAAEVAQYDPIGTGSGKLVFFNDNFVEPAAAHYDVVGQQIRWVIRSLNHQPVLAVAQMMGDSLQVNYDDGRARERYVKTAGIDQNKNLLAAALSEPVPTIATSGSAASDVVYIAFAAGELSNTKTVRMRNVSTGVTGSAEHVVVNGGLDPVAISASVGDTLEMFLTSENGFITSVKAAVPAKKAPRVVRVDPPKGRTDVALNARILVVFSEPVDPSSITPASLSLTHAGQPVAGTFLFPSGPTLSVQFAASSPLAPSATYNVNIGQNIRDLSGDALDEVSASYFITTVAANGPPAGANVRVTTTTTGDQIPSSYLATIYGASAQPIPANGSVTFDNIPLKTAFPGVSFYVILSGLPDHCSVTTANPRAVPLELSAGQTVNVGFTVLCDIPGPTTPATTQQIAFVRGHDIFAVNADGTNEIRLTNQGENADPAWSPDGTRIAYSGLRNGTWNVYAKNADGTNETRRSDSSPPWGFANRPAWSPNGSNIAFATMCEGQGCIRVSDANGFLSAVRIGNPQGYHTDPSWSPDGKKIAFVSDWDAYDFVYDIYVSNVDGSNIQQLTHGFAFWPGLHYYLHPTWSPDGTKIAVVFSSIINVSDQRWSVAVMNADGSNFTPLAFAGDIPWVQLQDPGMIAWSPDGRGIAFSKIDCRMEPGQPPCTTLRSIRYVNVDGTGERLLVANAHSPTWRR